jgi:MFS family permease
MYRDLILVALALFTWGVGEGMFLLFQPLYLEYLGAGPLAIGTILGGWGMAMALSHLPAGYLSDKIGRRPLLWSAWLMGLAATLLMAAANSLPVFILGLLAYGVTAFVISPLNSYITAARGRFSVGRALTFVSAAFNLGAVIGPILGGLIAERFGLRQIYPAAAGIFVVSTLLVLMIRPQPLEVYSSTHMPGALRLNGGFGVFLGMIFLAMFAMYLPQPLSPNFLQNAHQITFGQIGQLGAIGSLGVVAFNLILGHFNPRMGFILGQISVGFFAILLLNGTGMPAFIAAYFLLGGYRAARTLASAQARDLVQSSRMGLAYGMVESAAGAAMILSPPAAGYLFSRDPGSIYPVSLVLITISLLLGSMRWWKTRTSGKTAQVIF